MSGDLNRDRPPSLDEALRSSEAKSLIARFGRVATTQALREAFATARERWRDGGALSLDAGFDEARRSLEAQDEPRLRAVFNLTGAVIHTNLGRALLAQAAIDAATLAMREAVALEFDLESGGRGERDALLRDLLRELTGAEDATLVNNNAAAVVIALNSFAQDKDVVVSRGELIEIGGAFRLPDIMARAGAVLCEVGTTNRTHFSDYENALTPRSGLIMKVHTSNYRVEGFTCAVSAKALAPLARAHGVPLLNDLGSGTLIDLSRYGLPREPTVREAVNEGADLVTFSGDKLLGGAQAGFIVGRADLIARINKNPLKRAMRVDKIRLAALEATLRLYRRPERLAERLPTLRVLSRPRAEIAALAERIAPYARRAFGGNFIVSVTDCASQVGSGALPLETLPSTALRIQSADRKNAARDIGALAAALRRLPTPIIGRIEKGALLLDLRCLESEKEPAFIATLARLSDAAS